ncbi:hypothetical protein BC628DRAFT_1312233 [Trametes gibbosa]|nr:hypothetical protein BC628DRAFT_1312233 [Trametes gibbosa]
MGNSVSSGRGHHEDMVDFGYLTPQGIYTGPRDWNQSIVTQLIIERKLAPFYRPLEDYDESWDDDQILAARKEPPESEGGESSRAESISSAVTNRGHQKRPSAVKEPTRHPEAAIYRDAMECPICFLYYPPNINRSRCCDQAICTECFVQIKRADPTTTHLVSEPASCPYCVQEDFGIVYTPPSWRAGLGSEGATPPSWPDSPKATSTDTAPNPTMKRRRKSFGANDPDVVTVDHIHPDWEAKLASVRAAVARRANRRIIMRQVGDRLIPVGVTSGRVHALPPDEGGAEVQEGNSDRGSRRFRRRQQNQELNQFLGNMGLGGQDLEELMVMEAMRLSLIEHEAQQRREREEEAKKQSEEGAVATAPDSTQSTPSVAVVAPTDSSVSSHTTPTDSTPPLLPPPAVHALPHTVPPVSPSSTISALPPPTGANDTDGQPGSDSSPLPSTASPAEPEASTPIVEQTAHPSTPPAPSRPRTPESPSAAAETTPAALESQGSGSTISLPLDARPLSLSSSLAPSTYDVLPSSPDSTISNKPLLHASTAGLTPGVEGEASVSPSN